MTFYPTLHCVCAAQDQKSSGNFQTTVAVPSVKEGLYDLRADRIARQIGDSVEVLSPEGMKRILRSGACFHTMCNMSSCELYIPKKKFC